APFDDQLVVLANGKIALTARSTITDGDGDTATDSATVDLGGNVRFADDGPTVTTTGTGPALVVDETNLTVNASASFAANFVTAFGADGPAASGSLTYALDVVAGPSGLVDTATGQNVILSLTAGGVVEGRTAVSGALVFTVTVAADGTVTLDQQRAVRHADANNPNDPLTLSAAKLITLTATARDFDGDTASASLNIAQRLVFKDDAPSIDVVAGPEAGVVLTTRDANTDGDPTDTDTATSTAAFGGVFSLTFAAGADGAATPVLSYALSVTDAVSGLTSGGAAINLYLIDGRVVGSTAATQGGVNAGNTVFDLSVSSTGAVTLNQYQQIDHAVEGTTTAPFDDQLVVLANGKIALTARSTITDGDGDTATDSATVDLGGNVRFADDGPTVTTTGTGPALVVDETNLTVNASASFAANFVTAFGADGPAASGSLTYALDVVAGPSGLVDTATGQNVILSLTAGGVVEGRTAVSGALVFTVTVAADGTVTLDQQRAVRHADANNPNDPLTLSAAKLITLTATARDFDGDTASASLNIAQRLVFKDDAPSIDVVAGPEAGVVLTTRDANTDGDPTDTDTATSTAAFGGVFSLTFAAGADGAATPVLSYALSVTDAVSGLTSGGAAINLYLIDGRVVGSTAATQGGVNAGNTVFDLSVSSTGAVTLNQYQQIDHAVEGTTTAPFDDQLVVLANGKIALTARSTITDGDGDTATDSATVDLGGNVRFADDGPTVTTTGTGPALVVDETNLTVNASASFAANFVTAFGADGPAASGSLTYALDVVAGPSGLVDTATGQNVILSLTAGGVVEGRTAVSGALVFTVTVAADGTVTLDQQRAVRHADANNPNDPLTLSAAKLITLTATARDFDGDTASASLNIAQRLVFKDDAPSIDVVAGPEAGVVLTTRDANTDGDPTDTDTATSTAAFGGVFSLTFAAGADGAATPVLSYALSVTDAVSGLTSGGAAINLYLIDGRVVGSTAATQGGVNAGNTVFDLSVSSTGAVTLNQYQQIDHAVEGTTTAPFDDQLVVLANGKIALTARSTITDGDGDTATDSATVDLGGNVRFADDGPTVTTTGTGPALVVDETNL
ncbi:DUF5801 repeats-in-toxin domain-containing protein, partial [Erythrobacter sp. T5W1-R]|uniref:DUF5801 repeats-in-toxin domain-containing protein n=1 Tax=Erythrobacter sp. T5W1-R TaxID=3101752 RepID=UPI002AFE5A65